eukprot:4888101-Amphidinium_carterae.2
MWQLINRACEEQLLKERGILDLHLQQNVGSRGIAVMRHTTHRACGVLGCGSSAVSSSSPSSSAPWRIRPRVHFNGLTTASKLHHLSRVHPREDVHKL